jgi:glycosyltransferase involved in cell wall biosynthesis
MFVLSSVSEGICLTLLEAMAAGLPVVATDVGGNREIVVDGRTGRLVPARDPEALAKTILAMCENTVLARDMGQRGRERVVNLFDVRTMVARYEAIYRELLCRAASGDAPSRGCGVEPIHNPADEPKALASTTT